MSAPEADDARDAAAFRRLLEHLRKREDTANIDLMILAGFCRNCLADWVRDAAVEQGTDMSRDDAREYVYGEPYPNWKSRQPEATLEQLALFKARGVG